MKYNKHQQQITNKLIICITETKKLSLCIALHVTKSEANKILEDFTFDGFIFDEKGVFYILTAFSSFTENVSINFEHKNFKSLIML